MLKFHGNLASHFIEIVCSSCKINSLNKDQYTLTLYLTRTEDLFGITFVLKPNFKCIFLFKYNKSTKF